MLTGPTIDVLILSVEIQYLLVFNLKIQVRFKRNIDFLDGNLRIIDF